MLAAVVRGPGQSPVFGEFTEPVATAGSVVVTVTAAALSPTTRSRAEGSHYASTTAVPFVPGIDGVGRLPDGHRVYFLAPEHPFGSLAPRALVDRRHCITMPDDLDDVTAAALAIPGMSSWAALTERANVAPGETVLINGAAGAAGRLALQIARHLGAGKVIATARNRASLDELALLGADAVVPLVEDAAALEAAFQPYFAAGVDIVLDYLWGPSAEALLAAAAKASEEGRRLRYVEIGSSSRGTISLPSAVLRATAIELIGSGTGSVPLERIGGVIDELLHAAVLAGFKIDAIPRPLSEIEAAWATRDPGRIVLVP